MSQLSLNLGASNSCNPQGLSRPVTGLLYLYHVTGLLFPQTIFRHRSQQPNSGLGHLISEVSRSHIIGHTQLLEHIWRPDKFVAETPYLHNVRQIQSTKINALIGTRTRNPKNREEADLYLRPHGNTGATICVQTSKSVDFSLSWRDQWYTLCSNKWLHYTFVALCSIS